MNPIEDSRFAAIASNAKRLLATALKVAAFPLARLRWAAAEDARKEERWADVVTHLEKMHTTRWENDNSHYLLGLSYTNLRQWNEAVIEFEKVAGPLGELESLA